MTQEKIEQFLLSLPGAWRDDSLGEAVNAFKVKNENSGQEKLFAVVVDQSKPLRVSLKCDPLLAQNLRQKYESVQPGENLNKKHWNTIVCSGQLTNDDIFDLARLSYEISKSGEG